MDHMGLEVGQHLAKDTFFLSIKRDIWARSFDEVLFFGMFLCMDFRIPFVKHPLLMSFFDRNHQFSTRREDARHSS